jgi:hypothetical protein
MPTKAPWNNWFHICGSTYGQWVRGDPRGWRARHHREHVEGDYKKPPPPGKYKKEFEQSKRLMKRERVKLTPEQREITCRIMGDTLKKLRVELIDWCVGAKHFHGLARFTPLGKWRDWDLPRVMVGKAKGVSARELSKRKLVPLGGVWAKRCKVKSIEDRKHQLNVAKYIPLHARKGAIVYSLLLKRDAQQVKDARSQG